MKETIKKNFVNMVAPIASGFCIGLAIAAMLFSSSLMFFKTFQDFVY